MKTEATQPKHTQGELEIIEDKRILSIREKESKEVFVYRVNATTMNPAKNQANAQRIVKAVNMHDKLVTALRVLYTAYMREDVLENVSNGEEKDIQSEIEQLLKQAEQK